MISAATVMRKSEEEQADYEMRRSERHEPTTAKFKECAFQFSDALAEAKTRFDAKDFAEASAELRRALRELDAARAALAKAGV